MKSLVSGRSLTFRPMDPGPRPTNAEMAQLVAMLADAGLVEVYPDREGREVYRLADDGMRVGHMLAMRTSWGSGSGGATG